MNTRIEALTREGRCGACGHALPFRALDVTFRSTGAAIPLPLAGELHEQSHAWDGDVLSLHVEARNTADSPRRLQVDRVGGGGVSEVVPLAPGESHRFVVSRSSRSETAVKVRSEPGLETRLFHLLDRAHFPA
jgi:hypothetical protein